jgi:hypothetical protein
MMRPMTRQQREASGARPFMQPQSVPSPITGWNTRDALDAMPPTDAVLLDNWYPDAGGVNLRNGYVPYSTGLGVGAVKTLAEYNAGTIRKLLAGASGAIYDVSSSGAVGAPLASGFGSDAWQTASFLSKLFFCNGVDTVKVFDGTSLSNSTFTGVTLSTLVGVAVYQQRLFFWQNNSTGFWYAQLNSIDGALAFYDLQAFAPRGGNLIAITLFSHDGGNGVLDFIAFILSSGDVIMFNGNDPSNANAWSMLGRYRISPPVGPRAVAQYGADSFLTTYDDHVPLQQQLVALKLGQMPPRSKISNAVQAAVIANKGGFGWQALYYPKGRRLIFNIPNLDGTFSQHIQNMSIQAWCRFTNMNSYCWGLFNDNLFFGGAGGIVYQADTGSLDVLGQITATAQQAWNTFDSPVRKRIMAVRPVIQAQGTINYSFKLGFDYGDINVGISATSPATGSPWDISPWDTSPWSAEANIDARWRIGAGTGQAVGWVLKIQAQQAVQYLRTDFKGEIGIGL